MVHSKVSSSALRAIQFFVKMFSTNVTTVKMVRTLTIISIISLIIVSIYYLNCSHEVYKMMVDQVANSEETYARHAIRNVTLSRMLFEPLRRSAYETFEKHGPSAIVNMVTFSVLIGLSIFGLMVTLKKSPILLIIYGLSLDAVYSTSFLHVSRVKPWICAFVVFVSILAFFNSRHLLLEKRATLKGSIPQANSERQLIKEEHISDVV